MIDVEVRGCQVPNSRPYPHLEMMRVDHARKLLYSDFFAQMQSAQDLLAERLEICLVLVNREGQETTLPSALPLLCNEHERSRNGCPDCHLQLIAQLSPSRDAVRGTCPNGLHLAALQTSIRTDDGGLYLLAGRTADRAHLENQIDLLRSIYSLPFETPVSGKRSHAPASAQVPAQSTLTSQESRVLACIVSGLPNKDIASQLCISQSTVKAHVASILKKLNLSNRTEASVYALKNGIQLGDEHE